MDKIKWQIKNFLRKVTAKIDLNLYKHSDLVVIANNCWGGEIYKRFGIPFNTPFIGLFIFGTDYIKLLKNFEDYMLCDMKFVETSKHTSKKIEYPIGLLKDIEIHFMHYKTKEEALSKWNRRTSRLLKKDTLNNAIFKFCDRDGATNEELEAFHSLPYTHKISFGVHPFLNNNHIQINESKEARVPDGVELYVLCQKYLDLYYWIEKGEIKKSLYSTIKTKLDIA